MRSFSVGDVVRMPNYELAGGYRAWVVVGCHLGASKQESTYQLKVIDMSENKIIHVPCLIMETHSQIEVVN